MGTLDGVFRRNPINEYSVICGYDGCCYNFVIHYSTMAQAKQSAREDGWRFIAGSWYCSGHVIAVKEASCDNS